MSRLLDHNIIEDSHSPWSPLVVLDRKNDGTHRFCVDYRRLNDVTTKDSHPLPRVDDTLDRLSGARIFTTIDLTAGYWQIPLNPDDKEKNGFLHWYRPLSIPYDANGDLECPAQFPVLNGACTPGSAMEYLFDLLRRYYCLQC